MKKHLAIASSLLFATTIFAQHSDMKMGAEKPATLMPGLGSLHHPVSTDDSGSVALRLNVARASCA